MRNAGSIVNILSGNGRALALMLVTAVLVVLAGTVIARGCRRLVSGHARRHNGKRGWLNAVLHVLMAVPPTVLEVVVLFWLLQQGLLFAVAAEGTRLVEPVLWAGAALISLVLAVPPLYLTFLHAGAAVPSSVLAAARTIGMPENQITRKLILPGTFRILLRGYAAAFARAAGEYGAMMILAERMEQLSGENPARLQALLLSPSYGMAWLWAGLWLCAAGVVAWVTKIRE